MTARRRTVSEVSIPPRYEHVIRAGGGEWTARALALRLACRKPLAATGEDEAPASD